MFLLPKRKIKKSVGLTGSQASFKYFTALMYLRTGIYHDQSLHDTQAQRRSVINHCRHTLAMAVLVLTQKGIE